MTPIDMLVGLALAVGGCSVKPRAQVDPQALMTTAAKYAFYSEPGPQRLDPQTVRDAAVLDEAADLVRDNPQWGRQMHDASRFLDAGRTSEAKDVLGGLGRTLRYGEVLSATKGLNPVCDDPRRANRRGKVLQFLAHGLAIRAPLVVRDATPPGGGIRGREEVRCPDRCFHGAASPDRVVSGVRRTRQAQVIQEHKSGALTP